MLRNGDSDVASNVQKFELHDMGQRLRFSTRYMIMCEFKSVGKRFTKNWDHLKANFSLLVHKSAESTVDSHSLRDESTLDQGSPQDTVDDDNRSSSSSQDLLQSMDEISSGSLSPEVNDRESCIDRSSPMESGIGTASPPRSTDRRSSKRE